MNEELVLELEYSDASIILEEVDLVEGSIFELRTNYDEAEFLDMQELQNNYSSMFVLDQDVLGKGSHQMELTNDQFLVSSLVKGQIRDNGDKPTTRDIEEMFNTMTPRNISESLAYHVDEVEDYIFDKADFNSFLEYHWSMVQEDENFNGLIRRLLKSKSRNEQTRALV